MKLAYVFDPLLPSTETDTEQAVNTITAMSKAGADVTLFLPREHFKPGAGSAVLEDYYKIDRPLNVEYLRSTYPAPHKWFRPLEKVGHATRAALSSQLRDFDVVYTRNIPMLVSGLSMGHRLAYETYRPWPAQYGAFGPFFKFVMSNKRFIGAVLHSDYARQQYIAAGVDPAKLRVVYNGYEPKLFEPRLDKRAAREQIGIDPDRPTAVYAGRVNMAKGLGVVLDMAERMPDVQFLLVGSEGQGEVEARAEGMANVRLFGWTPYDKLPPYLYAADALIVPPSTIPLQRVGNTVLPMKLFIYLASGRPILAPRSPDTAELLFHDENAWLIEPDDPALGAAELRKLVGGTELAERLGAAAATRAAELTWQARGERVVSFLEERLATM